MTDVPPNPAEPYSQPGAAGATDEIGIEFLKMLAGQFLGNLFKAKPKTEERQRLAPEPGIYGASLEILCSMIRGCPWKELAQGDAGIVGFEKLVLTFAAVAANAAITLDQEIARRLTPADEPKP